MTIETHPLEPFLPENAHILFLGSFPPPKARWSMDFFYPNWINDFWRVQGLLHFDDKYYFESKKENKKFDYERIVAFCKEKGLAFFDTARKVKRLKDNASDNFLEILEPTDVGFLLQQMSLCNRVVTTGGKASEELQQTLSRATNSNVELPAIGNYVVLEVFNRRLEWWRMPSTSRAYPLKLEKKAEYYKILFE